MGRYPKRYKELSEHQRDLVDRYIDTLLAEQQVLPGTPGNGSKAGKRKSKKSGTFEEIRTIRNRAGGNSYRWRYQVTYQDGKRVKSKSIGRVK